MSTPERAPEAATRAATAADRAAVTTLWQECGLTRPWNDPVADFDRALAGPSSTIWVREHAGQIIASAMVGYDGHRGWVYYLSVDPTHRSCGHGAALMAVAEDWLRKRGAPKLQLMVRAENAVANGFYEALGYEPGDSRLWHRWL